jgi:hypothetical protein
MKRIVSCTLIVPLAVVLALFMAVTPVSATEDVKTDFGSKYGEDLRRAKDAGFIVMAPTALNWADAKAFCQQQGGRLPLVNDSDSWALRARDQVTHIDGFGKLGRPWNEVGMDSVNYWTGTVQSEGQDRSWIVHVNVGRVSATSRRQDDTIRVVCVP